MFLPYAIHKIILLNADSFGGELIIIVMYMGTGKDIRYGVLRSGDTEYRIRLP